MRGGLAVGVDDLIRVAYPHDSIYFESRKRHRMAKKWPGMAVAIWVNAVPWIFTHG